MDQNRQEPSMNQTIFTLNLGVETTSLYLLCCGISDARGSIFFSDLSSVWNGDLQSLEKSLGTLEKLNILSVQGAPEKEKEHYVLLPVETWKI